MGVSILTMTLQLEEDVVRVRQRSRRVAELLGFEAQNQSRVATAVSEIARHALQEGDGGRVEFLVDARVVPQILQICVQAKFNLWAAQKGDAWSKPGMGIVSARRLMDGVEIRSVPGSGIEILMHKALPPGAGTIRAEDLERLSERLAGETVETPFDEVKRQNQELVHALEEVQARQDELSRLNRELEDTNRGVVALYAELEEKAKRLMHADEAKTRVFSYMSHEIRTPINSILGLSRMLLDHVDGDLADEQEKQVGFIRKSAEGLLELVNDILDLEKAGSGKVDISPTEISVEDLFGVLRGILRPFLENPAVTLIFEDPNTPPLYTDEGMLTQILRNLISNALKYTEQGEVRVSAVEGPDKTVVFSVSDTGIGIAPADHERIFQEYVQVRNPLQDRIKGTGLGLPLSRKLARLLGGDIHVESLPGEGATFTVQLLRVYEPGVEIPEEQPDEKPPAPDRREAALVIDDDEVSRYLLKGLLHGTSCALIEAQTGMEGFRLARKARPNVIFLDLNMPGMDGFETLDRLKTDPQTGNIPVVIYTSRHLSREDLARLDQRVAEILPKEKASHKEGEDLVRGLLNRLIPRH